MNINGFARLRNARSFIISITAILCVFLSPGIVSAQQGSTGSKTTNMAIATASLGGTYYIVGAGIADMLTKNLNGIKVSAIISQGSVGNPKMVDTSEAQLGITNYLSGYKALKGDAPYGKPMKIAGIMPLQFSILHLVTLDKNKDIQSLSDLKGKRIAMGPAGGGGALLFASILPFWGITLEQTHPSYISYSDGSDSLKDGNVQLTIPHGAPPMDAISSLATQAKIRFLSIDDNKIAQITAKYPFYEKAIIPAGTYPGVNQDVSAVGIHDILVINSNVDENTVYQITKAIWENLDQLRKLHPSLKNLTFEGYKDSLVPLHPGAKKFYLEKGIKFE
jgi:TRAP transporter TAXI family solute receptor